MINEKATNKAIEGFICSLLKGISNIIKAFYYGIFALKDKLYIFIVSAGISLLTVLYLKPKIFNLEYSELLKKGIYFTLVFNILILIFILGLAKISELESYYFKFSNIGFRDRKNKYPFLIKRTKKDKQIRYIFKSNIQLDDWKKNKGKIQTVLDVNILEIKEGKNKRLVEIKALPSNIKLEKIINWDDEFIKEKDGEIVVGRNLLKEINFNLNSTPHVLIAGETGSGKSVILRTILWQSIVKKSAVYMIDFKGGVEFSKQYENFGEVVLTRERALELLTDLVKENEKRLAIFRDAEVKNLKEYNDKNNSNLTRIILIIDELAEMLDKRGVSKEEKAIYEQLEAKLSTLARLSRATGINIIAGVQRPDAQVLTGQIKINMPVRICGRFSDMTASQIVLGTNDAVKLIDEKGLFLCKIGNEVTEFKAYYFDDNKHLNLNIDKTSPKLLIDEEKQKNSSRSSALDDKHTNLLVDDESTNILADDKLNILDYEDFNTDLELDLFNIDELL